MNKAQRGAYKGEKLEEEWTFFHIAVKTMHGSGRR